MQSDSLIMRLIQTNEEVLRSNNQIKEKLDKLTNYLQETDKMKINLLHGLLLEIKKINDRNVRLDKEITVVDKNGI